MRPEDEESLLEAAASIGVHTSTGAGLPAMKNVFGLPETVVCATLATVGGYMLKEGIVDRSKLASLLVVAGAALLAIGVLTLQAVIRSLLWHHAMLRGATNRQRNATGEIASSEQ